MLLMEKDAFLSQTRDVMAGFYDELTALPDIALSSLDPKTTALIVVDMVNGFAREGALASPRVDAMAGEIAALTEACRRKGFPRGRLCRHPYCGQSGACLLSPALPAWDGGSAARPRTANRRPPWTRREAFR